VTDLPSNLPKGLPENVEPYHESLVFTQASVPASLLNDHATKEGVWGVIHVLSGELVYTVPSTGVEEILSVGRAGLVFPAVPHRVSPQGDVSFYIEFWR
jgi:tellurite resistance-related uncharacterized protein